METEKLRKDAIRRHYQASSSHIFATICRFQVMVLQVVASLSIWKRVLVQDNTKAPKTKPNKLEGTMEQLILSIRDELEYTQYAQIETSAIAWEIQK